MKASEVRIGNWVGLWLNHTDVSNFQLELADLNRIFIKPQEYFAIPLTEEWLLKFGFEKYEFDNGQSPQYRHKERLLVIRDGHFVEYGSRVILESVHQLQNLYFALTGGEELQLSSAEV